MLNEYKEAIKLSETLSTPHVIVNLDTIKSYYLNMKELCGFADIYFAFKACPLDEIVPMLYNEGSNFDIASRYELDSVMSKGVAPERIFYGNTIKKAEDVKYFYDKGVRTFASDCENDVRKIAANAPGSNVYFRILLPETDTADWPLSRKFGCSEAMVMKLIPLAAGLGLKPVGVSFHVGSQQRNMDIWDLALETSARIFRNSPVRLGLVDLGGGLPAHYVQTVSELNDYAQKIRAFIEKHFPGEKPRFVMEPGRSLTADSGILAATVVEVEKKDDSEKTRWVYLDAGKFNGLIETMEESIKYRLSFSCDPENKAPKGPAILAGPTCDSMDIMYEKYTPQVPLDLKAGDRVYFLSTGAYTTSYASVAFNGFPPIKAYSYSKEGGLK